ncbi:MAG: leucine-rich repeat protein [Clostridia bacterium]|nr:leucine-rich repeat protein [Clostridia bacterium]
MKANNSGLRKNLVKILLVSLVVVISLIALISCNKNSVPIKEIVVNQNEGVFTLADFSISKITIDVVYQGATEEEEGDRTTIACESSMLTTEAKNLLKTVGEKEITIYYQGKTVIVNFILVDEDTSVFVVNFYDINKELIKTKKCLQGGSVDAPTLEPIEGKTFKGWYTADNKTVSLTNITESHNLYATYTEEKSQYKVTCIDYKKAEIKSFNINSGSRIDSSSLPTYSSMSSRYPELKGFDWAVPSEAIYSDTVVSMIPDFNYYSVLFAYSIDGKAGLNYIDTLSASVKYGTSVSESFNKAKQEIVKQGYTIKTEPSTSTQITKNTTFTFVVEETSITIKVYNDKNKGSIKDTASKKIGEIYKLPTTAASVSGETLSGWKIDGKNKVFTMGEEWTVSNEYGTSVNIIPQYVSITLDITFNFTFDDVDILGDQYCLTVYTNDYALGDVITFNELQTIFDEIVANRLGYKAAIANKTKGNVKYSVKDNGGTNAWNEIYGTDEDEGTISSYSIVSATYANTQPLTISQPRAIANSESEFNVVVSRETKGITYSVVENDEHEKIGYAVSGIDDNLISVGDVISIPNTHKGELDTKEYPVIKIDNDALLVGGYIITKLPNGLVEIGANAFKNSTILGEADFSKVTSIGANAFNGTTFKELNGKNANLSLSAIKTIGESAFANAVVNSDITISGEDITTISVGAFNGIEFKNENSKITLSENITSISANAFKSAKVESILGLSKVETIGNNAFDGAEVSTLSFSALTTIGTSAFANMSNLTSITIGGAVAFDFASLAGSTNIETVLFDKSVTNITTTNISDFAKITALNVNSENTKYYSDNGSLYSVSGTTYTLVYYPVATFNQYVPSIKSGYTGVTFDGSAFNAATVAILDLTNITGLTIGNTVTTGTVYSVILPSAATNEDITKAEATFNCEYVYKAGDENNSVAFYSSGDYTKIVYLKETYAASNAYAQNAPEQSGPVTFIRIIGADRNATKIVIPAVINNIKVTKFRNNLFKDFTNLEDLDIQGTDIIAWNSSILSGCSNLKTFSIAGFDEDAIVELNDFKGNGWFESNNLIIIGGRYIGYNDEAVDMYGETKTTITEEESALLGIQIPEGFFAGKNITSVVLNSRIEVISKNAFNGCSYLESFEAKGVIKEIGANAFEGCTALKEICINRQGATNAISVGASAFEECTHLTKVSIYGMINSNVKAGQYLIPVKLFYGCSDLEEFNYDYANAFDKDNEGSNAFYNCSSLKSFDFNTIKSSRIENGAFYGCTNLKYLDFSESDIVAIGESAFEGCSGIVYIKLSEKITKIEAEAFSGLSNGLVVEISYAQTDTAGLYTTADAGKRRDAASLSVDAFSETASVDFYISGEKPAAFSANESLNTEYTKAKYTYHLNGSDYPTISYNLAENLDEEKRMNFAKDDASRKLLLLDSDVEAPTYDGYTFVGWYAEREATEDSRVTFPKVFKSSATLYAKYYTNNQGSLNKSDVSYVYMITEEPYVELERNEIVNWYIKNGNDEVVVYGFPYVVETNTEKEDKYILKAVIGEDTNSDGEVDIVKDSVEFENTGITGYAIVKYADTNASGISLPNVYNDDTNGEKDIIAIFAGSFSNLVLDKIDKGFLPDNIKAIFMGKVDDTIVGRSTDTTFNNELENIVIPKTVEYIESGVFKSLENTDIEFEAGSELKYATTDSFYGSKWYINQLKNLRDNNGFVIAGNLALQYFGSGLYLEYSSEGKVSQSLYGIAENEVEKDIEITVFYENNSNCLTIKDKVIPTVIDASNKIYKYEIVCNAPAITITICINTSNESGSVYRAGSSFVKVETGLDIKAMLIDTVEDLQVLIPLNVIKLNNEIFSNNEEINTVIINNNLEYIGDLAFYNSKISEINYGTANNEQWTSKIKVIGKDAFTKSTYYTNNKNVIIGTIFLKYNNLTGNERTLSITEAITEIAPYAFANVGGLESVTFSSKSLTKVGEFAFYNSSLKNITIPENVTYIARNAFSESRSISSIDLSKTKIKELSKEAFLNCTSLATLKLPTTAITLLKDSLKGCTKLKTIEAAGIATLAVKTGSAGNDVRFESCIEETLWYKVAQGKVEQTLILGNVYVKYIPGTASYSRADVTVGADVTLNTYYELDNDEYVLTQDTKFASNKYYYVQDKATINIPSNIKTISTGAFYNIDSIAKIVLPDSIITIDEFAFAEMDALEEIVFGGNEAYINAFAFKNDKKLKKVSLPSKLVEIGQEAFYNTAITTEVLDESGIKVSDEGFVIPNTVTTIGDSAFANVKTLTYVVIEGTLKELGENAFNVGVGGKLYKVEWALVYDDLKDLVAFIGTNDSGKLAAQTMFKSDDGVTIRIYVPDAVFTKVNNSQDEFNIIKSDQGYRWNIYANNNFPEVSFDNNNYSLDIIKTEYILESSIRIPVHTYDANTNSSYTFMGWYLDDEYNNKLVYPYYVYSNVKLYARWYNNNIANISNAKGADGTLFEISQGNNKLSITNIDITDNDSGVVYIPNTIEGIVVSSISLSSDVAGVRKIVITQGSNLNGMQENIFNHFVDLESIEIRYIDNTSTIDYKVQNVDITCDGVTKTFEIIYSNEQGIAYGNTLIAFIGNVEKAFFGDYIENIADEEERASAISKLENAIFNIPTGVQKLLENSLSKSGLKYIGLPKTLTSIGENGLGEDVEKIRIYDGINLTDVTFESISNEAPIKSRAMANTTYEGYKEISGLKQQGTDFNSTFYALGNIIIGLEIQGVTTNATLTFSDNIAGIDITVIGSEIYNSASPKITVTSIMKLPVRLIRVNTRAFNNINLSATGTIEAGNNLSDIANEVFGEMDFYMNAQNTIKLGSVLIKYTGSGRVDPSDLSGITSISSKAFANSLITSIEIPAKVTTIGSGAFYASPNLTSVKISDSVTKISESAFSGCEALTTVEFDTTKSALSTIEDRAFYGCKALKEIRLPANLKTIGDSAFEGCITLNLVTFIGYTVDTTDPSNISYIPDSKYPSTLEKLGDSTFASCSALQNIDIPNNLEAIPTSCFSGCKGLLSVKFSENGKLKLIDENAFLGCENLGSQITKKTKEMTSGITVNAIDLCTLVLPKSLEEVANGAFKDCKGLWGVEFRFNIGKLGSGIFDGCDNLVKVVFRRSTAPVISADTFPIGDVNRKYRLRIYVIPGDMVSDNNENIDANLKRYRDSWKAINDSIADFIYVEKSDYMPKVTLSYTPSGSAKTEIVIEGVDGVIMPMTFISGGNNYPIYSFKCTEATAKSGSGTTSKVFATDNDRYTVVGGVTILSQNNGETVAQENQRILIFDYDTMTFDGEQTSNN